MRAPMVYWLFRFSLAFLTLTTAAFAADKPETMVHAAPGMA
jgi:hypothetical protein